MKRPVLYADLLDMRFEGREKAYGAYPLRKSQPWYLFTAFAVVGGLFLATVFVMAYGGEKEVIEVETTHEYPIECPLEPPRKIWGCRTWPPPSGIVNYRILIPEKKAPQTIASQTPRPAANAPILGPEVIQLPPQMGNVFPEFLEEIELRDSTFTENIGLENQSCDCKSGHIKIPNEGEIGEPVIIEEEPDVSSFMFDGERPIALNLSEFKRLVGFPDEAYDRRLQAKVIFRITIDKRGYYVSHKLIRCDHPIFLSPAEKHLPMLRFTPAIQGGKPVPFEIELPLYFKVME